MNANPIVSSQSADNEIADFKPGHYYLVETKAPDSYVGLAAPVEFDLSATKITSSDGNVYLDNSDSLLICVKNQSGYELPHTGGIGTTLFAIFGIAIMSLAAAYISVLRRRRGL